MAVTVQIGTRDSSQGSAREAASPAAQNRTQGRRQLFSSFAPALFVSASASALPAMRVLLSADATTPVALLSSGLC